MGCFEISKKVSQNRICVYGSVLYILVFASAFTSIYLFCTVFNVHKDFDHFVEVDTYFSNLTLVGKYIDSVLVSENMRLYGGEYDAYVPNPYKYDYSMKEESSFAY
jgi:hypothetical protein